MQSDTVSPSGLLAQQEILSMLLILTYHFVLTSLIASSPFKELMYNNCNQHYIFTYIYTIWPIWYALLVSLVAYMSSIAQSLDMYLLEASYAPLHLCRIPLLLWLLWLLL